MLSTRKTLVLVTVLMSALILCSALLISRNEAKLNPAPNGQESVSSDTSVPTTLAESAGPTMAPYDNIPLRSEDAPSVLVTDDAIIDTTSQQINSLVSEADICTLFSMSQCYQSPTCTGWYGPSVCSGDICTTDISYRGCIPISEERVARQGSRLNANELLPTTYISGHDWPPVMYHEEHGWYQCPIDTDGWQSRSSRTYETTIDNATYCVTVASEGAAGSLYDEYVYSTENNGELYRIWFTLRSVQCGNYGDDAVQALCQTERENFAIDRIVHDLVQSSFRAH